MNGVSQNNQVVVVLGSQWGDEGKGKLVDLLAEKADVVARCQGGNNAGHTVVANSVSYAFHLLPSGLVHPNAKAVLGNGVVIHIEEFLDEIAKNEAKGLAKITPDRLKISDRAHLVFELHRVADKMQEEQRKSNKEMLGTTKKGIGPCYSSKASRSGLRICDLVASDFENRFVEKFKRLASDHERAYGTQVDIQAEVSKYKELAKKIKPYVTETVSYMHKVLDAGEKVLVEGANASMLDIDFGTYPYVTSSNCSIGGVCTGLGLPPGRIGKVFGVVKAYTTRVGAGAFPTELDNELGQYLQKHGAEFGVTTGRKRRCGWLDLAMLKFTHCLNNFTALALTKLDILSDLDEIKIGVNYLKEGSRPMIHYPSSEQDFEDVSVDYVTLPGWKCDITQCKRFEELPSRAQDYVTTIESIVNVPIWWIGVGQSREAMIERGPPSSVF